MSTSSSGCGFMEVSVMSMRETCSRNAANSRSSRACADAKSKGSSEAKRSACSREGASPSGSSCTSAPTVSAAPTTCFRNLATSLCKRKNSEAFSPETGGSSTGGEAQGTLPPCLLASFFSSSSSSDGTTSPSHAQAYAVWARCTDNLARKRARAMGSEGSGSWSIASCSCSVSNISLLTGDELKGGLSSTLNWHNLAAGEPTDAKVSNKASLVECDSLPAQPKRCRRSAAAGARQLAARVASSASRPSRPTPSSNSGLGSLSKLDLDRPAATPSSTS
mmetsp:Transcript_76559/g.219277  ORF Transcript_76559/g.219277 Transcript_76559/m.219277 type:complete len:278 (-) Transcript_76559:62-895(-)